MLRLMSPERRRRLVSPARSDQEPVVQIIRQPTLPRRHGSYAESIESHDIDEPNKPRAPPPLRPSQFTNHVPYRPRTAAARNHSRSRFRPTVVEHGSLSGSSDTDEAPVRFVRRGSLDWRKLHQSYAHHREHRHARRRRHFVISKSNTESDVDGDAYDDFNLSRDGRASPSQNSNDVSFFKPTDTQDLPAAKYRRQQQQPPSVNCLALHSKYTGDGVVGGVHSIDLSVPHEPGHNTQNGLFRWIHFEDTLMNLNSFQDAVNGIAGLNDSERSGLNKVLDRVRKRYDKPLPVSKGRFVRIMDPGAIHENISSEGRSKSAQTRAVTWFCFPFFVLKQYNDLPPSASPSSHPTRTLMQSRSSFDSRARDLRQAVCHLKDTPKGHCYHRAKVWALVLGDKLLITCAAVPQAVLTGRSFINVVESRPESTHERAPRITVSAGRGLLWSFTTNECRSWFAFVSKFSEYGSLWPNKIQFTYNGKVVNPGDWPKVIALADQTNVRLDLKIVPLPKQPLHGVLIAPEESHWSTRKEGMAKQRVYEDTEMPMPIKPPSTTTDQPRADTEKNENKKNHGLRSDYRSSVSPNPAGSQYSLSKNIADDFHALMWWVLHRGGASTSHSRPSTTPSHPIGTNQPTSRRGSFKAAIERVMNTSRKVKRDLAEMDDYLLSKTPLTDRRAYRNCRKSQRRDVYSMIRQENDNLEVSGSAHMPQNEVEDHVDIVNEVNALFEFFLSPEFEGPTVPQYWGAVHQYLLLDHNRTPDNENLESVETEWFLDAIKSIAKEARAFKEVFSHALESDWKEMHMPKEFPRAWLHLINCLVSSTTNVDLFFFHSTKARELLHVGAMRLVHGEEYKSLLDRAVVMPFEIMLLINRQLMEDVTSGHQDIDSTYQEYLSLLESDMEQNPLDRNFQNKLSLLKTECLKVKETLGQQLRFVELIRKISQNRSSPLIEGNVYLPEVETDRKADSGARHHHRHGDVFTVIEAPKFATSPTDPAGYSRLLNADSQAFIELRIRHFDEILQRANELEAWNLQRIDSNKDRQEAAIYVFTIVTILFLPIGTVATIFGMNTADIRDTPAKQWVFWAVALPLTALVVVCSSLWIGGSDTIKGFIGGWGLNRGYGLERPSRDTHFGITSHGTEHAGHVSVIDRPGGPPAEDYVAPQSQVWKKAM